jgi:predicted ATPase
LLRGRQVDPPRRDGLRVVRAETARGGDGLPWVDEARFARLCITTCLGDLARPVGGVVLHDRSLVDAVAWLRRTRRLRDGDAELLEAHRYSGPAVLAPPWPELFETSEGRRHGFDEAVAEYEDLRLAYPAAGYPVVELPRTSVTERADWLEALVARQVAA